MAQCPPDVEVIVTAVQFRVLGPVEATRDGRRLPLGGPRPRTVLSTLLLADGRWVRTDSLVDAVWGDTPPATATKTIQKYVSHLRAVLGEELILSRPAGYELVTESVDSRHFERLIEQASTEPDRPAAARILEQALAMWRGEPYGDLPDLVPAQTERRRLVERRLAAIESLVDLRLALGHHTAVAAWLEELVAEHPLRERLWGALMLALYRCGRQADALGAFARVRSLLTTELGTEPTPALRAIHELVLRQADPETAGRATSVRPAAQPGPLPLPLPLRLTSLVGRDRERREVMRLLGLHRLVSLTGPPGSGKTRLAVELVTDWPDGGWFVELGVAAEPSRVPAAVAAALRLREHQDRDPLDAITNHLASQTGLLVIDNCEHLVDAAAQLVAAVLRTAAEVRILTTSRQSLSVAGEVVYDVPPLALPATDDLAAVRDSSAVTLLVERAQAVDTRFRLDAVNAPALARIARRLDGMPLAIELAAGRLRVFGAARLADLLDDRFRVLVSTQRDAPARHQTLRTAVAWSYELLEPPERKLFRDLSVFDGGFVLDAAERVNESAIALLPAMVDRSLVVVDARPSGTRYRLLETLREYGRAQLEPDEAAELRERHLTWVLEFAEINGNQVRGPRHLEAVELLDAERDNVRTALVWALHRHRVADVLQLASSLSPYWDERTWFDDGLAVLREALAHTSEIPKPLLIRAHLCAAGLALNRSDHALATTMANTGLQLACECADELGIWRATVLIAKCALYQSDYATAGDLLSQSREAFSRLGMTSDLAEVLGRLGHLHRLLGDFTAARDELEQAMSLRARLGDRIGRAWSLWQLGVVARYRGDLDRARECNRESLAEYEAHGDAGGLAHVRYSMGDVARAAGDLAGANHAYQASLVDLRRQGDRRCVASTLYNLGELALAAKDPSAGNYLEQSLTLRRALGDRAGVAECLEALALMTERAGDGPGAIRLLAQGATIRARTGAAPPADQERSRRELVEALRTAVGVDAFDEAWTEGSVSPL
jgi:predicted ATPase/DNA-binding SARP family transcriptional activator